MSETNWKSLVLAALHRNRSDKGVRFLQLATVDRHNCPRNRTVVFRGFVEGTQTIMLAVDSRSEKLEQLTHNPHAAICWYFSKTREQFRLTGTITIVTEKGVLAVQGTETLAHRTSDNQRPENWQQNARLQLWGRLSGNARLLWYWPCPKGARARADSFLRQPPIESQTPPDTFVLLLFEVSEVDRLELKGVPQNRTIFSRLANNWRVRAVNP